MAYYRTKDRKSPHNAYSSGERLNKAIAQLGYTESYSADYKGHYRFAKTGHEVTLDGAPSVMEAARVYPGYVMNKPWFEYDESTGEYLRFQFDDAQIDAETGEQLSYKNILVKYVEPDYYENGTPNYKVDGTGAGLFITNGKAVQVTWKKDSETSGPTKYYYEDGTEIVLNQGKTYICQVETTQNVTVE